MEETIPMGEWKWIDIPTNKFYREDASSAEILKNRSGDWDVISIKMKEKLTALFMAFDGSKTAESVSEGRRAKIL